MDTSNRHGLTPAATQYARPDTVNRHDLKWRITACLRDRLPNLHEVHITVFGGTVAVRGNLRSQHEKRLCLECCRHVPGVMRVVDELIVVQESPVYRNPGEDMS